MESKCLASIDPRGSSVASGLLQSRKEAQNAAWEAGHLGDIGL